MALKKISSFLETLIKMGVLFSALALFAVLVGLMFSPEKDEDGAADRQYMVAITQIIPHPSLDKIRQGILDELEKHDIKFKLVYENAQGNIATALQIGQKFVALKPDVIVSITTPSTQAVLSANKNRTIPVVFSAVSDPVQAKIVQGLNLPDSMISGVSDLSPIAQQVTLMKTFLKGKLKKIGVLYNPGEANSVALVALLTTELKENQIELVHATANSTTTVKEATQSLIGKVNAIYIPNDNTIIAAFDAVVQVTKKHKVPLFTADPESVERGALASISHNQYGLGRQTGQMVAKVLEGQSLGTLPVELPEQVELVINTKTARHLGLQVPKVLKDQADHTIH